MTDRELDAWVARELFAWTEVRLMAGECVGIPPGEGRFDICNVPWFSRDPAADYLVLKRVRETWNRESQRRFHFWLYHEWKNHRNDQCQFWLMQYTAGDYSRATCAALERKDEV